MRAALERRRHTHNSNLVFFHHHLGTRGDVTAFLRSTARRIPACSRYLAPAELLCCRFDAARMRVSLRFFSLSCSDPSDRMCQLVPDRLAYEVVCRRGQAAIQPA